MEPAPPHLRHVVREYRNAPSCDSWGMQAATSRHLRRRSAIGGDTPHFPHPGPIPDSVGRGSKPILAAGYEALTGR